ncbi:MAG: selenium-dependent molybdenum cofactor biosynthesis protein YqeB [candidate division Zixibacteria bacterium]|nr:selenium-dependent molybdenum cofactor biosynthesis protein YqeB [candidate division Zixibacteria bacterium]MDH3936633.1 selenium-dependent molybdenum cofactor biosynthesis protein YqeB [candidate division Zixibacteria bacterium]MDH4035216.1 selenium-dependent molybdenum cofactor biosynthesis protein YqeB [candidate division Zixibacteria bacterium]
MSIQSHKVSKLIVVRGAGEMASGVIHRLHTDGCKVLALEQTRPTCVRRAVCFAEAVFEREVAVEAVTARLVEPSDLDIDSTQAFVPLLIDPAASAVQRLNPAVLIDARMTKLESDCSTDMAPLVIGLGPGFYAGRNCHAAVETNRGPELGQVILKGEAQPYTGQPAEVQGISLKRVLRAPCDGKLTTVVNIGDLVSPGRKIGRVADTPIQAEIGGVVRGLLRGGTTISQDQKVGDIDPRGDSKLCFRISDKARAIAGGVVEALTRLDSLRPKA